MMAANRDSERATSQSVWRRLFVDEDAQAMAEMVVLLPVYLLLIVGMIYTGHLVLIRQQVVEAARWYAWSRSTGGQRPERLFLSNFRGTGRAQVSADVAVQVQAFDFKRAVLDRISGTRAGRNLAQDLVMDRQGGRGTNLERRQARVQASYSFPWFVDRLGVKEVGQSCQHVVYVHAKDPRQSLAQRRRFRRFQPHPIELTTARPPAGAEGLEAYVPSRNFWLPLEEYSFASSLRRPDSGINHERHSCLWNTTHILGNPTETANPFFLHPLRED